MSVDYRRDDGSLHVQTLTVADPSVIAEAARWASRHLETPVSVDDLDGVDLTGFVVEALTIGSRVIGLVGQEGETRAVRDAVQSAGEQVSTSLRAASEATDDALRRAQQGMADATKTATEAILGQVGALLGGESPELLERIRPFLVNISEKVERQVSDGMAAGAAAMREEHEQRHKELRDLIWELSGRKREEDARTQERSRTTVKGFDYEADVHTVIASIAADLGDDYAETGEVAGRLPRNKKGDGVITIAGGTARIVIEAHDGQTKNWAEYLEEAERNRGATVSVGVVKSSVENVDRHVRVVAPRRVVVVYDPTTDAPDLLRTVILLMRTVALTTTGRFSREGLQVADARIREAMVELAELDHAKKSAAAILGHVDKIDIALTRSMKVIERHLSDAVDALAGQRAEHLHVVNAEAEAEG